MIRSKKEWYSVLQKTPINCTEHFTVNQFMANHAQYSADKMFGCRSAKISNAPFFCMTKNKMIESIKNKRVANHCIIAEAINPEDVLVQGEYNGLIAEISFIKKMQREALNEQRIIITRGQLLGIIGYRRYHYLDDIHQYFSSSLDINKSPIVEFAVFNRKFGKFKKDIIIWEVRNY